MLLGFKCGNFRSIKDVQEITMIPGHTRNLENQLLHGKDSEGKDFETVKGVLLFGANASGKSNFYKAIRYSTRLIHNKGLVEGEEGKSRRERLFLSPFALDPESGKNPTMFEYEIEVKNHLIRYGFEIDSESKEIVSEWLKEFYVELDDRLIFLRNRDGVCEYDGATFHMKNDELFLPKFNDVASCPDCKDSVLVHDVWQWFWDSLAVLAPNSSMIWDYDLDDMDNRNKLAEVLSVFDTGIVGMDLFDYDESDGEPYDEPKNHRLNNDGNLIKKGSYGFFVIDNESKKPVKALRFIHGNGKNDVQIHMDQESDGTLRLMRLAPILIRDDKECVYILDELDRYLHPTVVYAFIEWFMKKNYKHNKQLIVITHNPHLLDQDLVRRDEIWFAQKDNEGKTEFYSLDDYNVRFDRKIERAYYDGVFDGLPRIILPSDIDDS